MASDTTSQTNDTIDDEKYPEMYFFLNEEESDVVFIIDGHRVPALTQVLRFKNKVFRAMFSGHFKESTDNVITIKDTTVDAFTTMLRYLYTEQLVLKDGKDMDLIGDVLAIADRYRALGLWDACGQHLKAFVVTIDNINVLYEMAVKYGLNEWMASLKAFIITNLDQFLSKTAEELIELNAITNNWWLMITNKRLVQTRDFFLDKSYDVINQHGSIYTCKQQGTYKSFDFDDRSIN